MTPFQDEIIMIPIADIKILNRRNRNKHKHTVITDNIIDVGMKNPVLVRQNDEDPNSKPYELIYGQGRIESFEAAGQTHIPAIIRQISRKQAMIESITENAVRSPNTPRENILEIKRMKEQGESASEIARKIGRSESTIKRMVRLLDKGEERLLAMVEKGKIPVTVAVEIAEVQGDEQDVLQDAYEKNLLRDKDLIEAKRMLQTRKTHGKAFAPKKKTKYTKASSVAKLMKDYKTMVARKKRAVHKAEMIESHLKFTAEAMYMLLQDENFRTLLKAEQLLDLPKWLKELMKQRGLQIW